MKIDIICAFALGVLALAGCSKDEAVSGSASIGGSKYNITSVYAFQINPVPEDGYSNTELCLVTNGGYYDEEEGFTTDWFFVDLLFWDEYVYGRLVEGTYTLGDDVLDEVAFCSDDYDIEAVEGTLTISSRNNGYSISFSGYMEDGSAVNFSYSGSITYIDIWF